jgi:hypothetical protein
MKRYTGLILTDADEFYAEKFEWFGDLVKGENVVHVGGGAVFLWDVCKNLYHNVRYVITLLEITDDDEPAELDAPVHAA